MLGCIGKKLAAQIGPKARLMPIVFLDTEFADLLAPELLSIDLVSHDRQEHYVELDLDSDIGQKSMRVTSEFVSYGGVIDQWGRVASSTCTRLALPLRTSTPLSSRNRSRAGEIMELPSFPQA